MNYKEYILENINADGKYVVWFVNNPSNKEVVTAKDRKTALEIFANKHGIKVSSYIQARKHKNTDPLH